MREFDGQVDALTEVLAVANVVEELVNGSASAWLLHTTERS